MQSLLSSFLNIINYIPGFLATCNTVVKISKTLLKLVGIVVTTHAGENRFYTKKIRAEACLEFIIIYYVFISGLENL